MRLRARSSRSSSTASDKSPAAISAITGAPSSIDSGGTVANAVKCPKSSKANWEKLNACGE